MQYADEKEFWDILMKFRILRMIDESQFLKQKHMVMNIDYLVMNVQIYTEHIKICGHIWCHEKKV